MQPAGKVHSVHCTLPYSKLKYNNVYLCVCVALLILG